MKTPELIVKDLRKYKKGDYIYQVYWKGRHSQKGVVKRVKIDHVGRQDNFNYKGGKVYLEITNDYFVDHVCVPPFTKKEAIEYLLRLQSEQLDIEKAQMERYENNKQDIATIKTDIVKFKKMLEDIKSK